MQCLLCCHEWLALPPFPSSKNRLQHGRCGCRPRPGSERVCVLCVCVCVCVCMCMYVYVCVYVCVCCMCVCFCSVCGYGRPKWECVCVLCVCSKVEACVRVLCKCRMEIYKQGMRLPAILLVRAVQNLTGLQDTINLPNSCIPHAPTHPPTHPPTHTHTHLQ